MQLDKKTITLFQEEILAWYAANKRNLPWRETHDPYKILVSEIMLQQTQVSRVIPKYEAWLEKFPTIESLAIAKKEDILHLWSGLGYNRRALYLQKCAVALQKLKTENIKLKTDDSPTYWPQTIEELEELPGIGPYTARAIACFAFHQQVAVVDTNVRKVILVKFSEDSGQARMTNKELQEIADELLPIGQAYDWNQALMDYSNIVLQKEKVVTKKQSTFKNSDRYYRGKLLRVLLVQKSLPVSEIGYVLRDDYSQKDEAWKTKLLEGLEKDGLLQIKESEVSI